MPYISYSQAENVPVRHPVYDFLIHCETRGYLPHFSSSDLPWVRSDVIKALNLISQKKSSLSNWETKTLNIFIKEFIPIDNQLSLFKGPSNTKQLTFKGLISDKEKYFYYYDDSSSIVRVEPLAEFDIRATDEDKSSMIATLGVRLSGSIKNNFGYYLQATNGRVVSGDRELALEDRRYNQSIKFSILKDDIDLSQSHIRYNNDWFYFEFGRQTRLLGAGYGQRLFISDMSPPFDAIKVGAKFKSFEYSYIHGSLLGLPDSYWQSGFTTHIDSKYTAQHRFAVRPSWGEIAFWENIIYSDRFPDLAYLNPLSFMKSLEHALHDRDNSLMGMDLTFRPIDGIQVKGSFLLDDIIFENIGKNFWSNKFAWNLGVMATLPFSANVALEYTLVKPYTFSHFNVQNSVTNDGRLLGSTLQPNTDELSLMTTFFYGQRYPIELDISFSRHGANIFREDTLYYNAGGDVLQTRRPQDSDTVEFLSGDLRETLRIRVAGGYEIFRGFSAHAEYIFRREDTAALHYVRLFFRYSDF